MVLNMTEEVRVRGPRVKPPRPTTPVERATITQYLDRSVPEKHKIATERALLKQMSRATAIKVKCLACCNYERSEVKDCAVITCPLWAYRPYQTAAVEDEEGDEIDEQGE
jgi:hypothetical protein